MKKRKRQTLFMVTFLITILMMSIIVLAIPPDWAKGKKDKNKVPSSPIPPGLEKKQEKAKGLNNLVKFQNRFKPNVTIADDGCKLIRTRNKVITQCNDYDSGLPGGLQ